ncbi:MAG: hypothetical protein AAF612_01895 [Planctomycetota bacterium]
MKSNLLRVFALGMFICLGLTTASCDGMTSDKYGSEGVEIGGSGDSMYVFEHAGDGEPIQIRVTWEHLSGPPLALYVLDEENSKKAKAWGPRGMPGVAVVEPAHKLTLSMGEQKSGWIEVPITGKARFMIAQDLPRQERADAGRSKFDVQILVKSAG